MTNFRLTVEYDGARYCGWQRQNNAPSIQASLEEALFKLSGIRTSIFAAGRTDAGVHAYAMTAHVELDRNFEADVVRDGLNFHLKPQPIAVLDVQIVADDFHARFSCVERQYEYQIINRRPPLTVSAGRAWHVYVPLEVEVMHQAAQSLVGHHDFTTFRASACQSHSPVKTLSSISVQRSADRIFLRCAAPSFLHHQVRSIAGTLVDVGRGKWAMGDVKDALRAADRMRCGQVAPAHGLYFVKAVYENP